MGRAGALVNAAGKVNKKKGGLLPHLPPRMNQPRFTLQSLQNSRPPVYGIPHSASDPMVDNPEIMAKLLVNALTAQVESWYGTFSVFRFIRSCPAGTNESAVVECLASVTGDFGSEGF